MGSLMLTLLVGVEVATRVTTAARAERIRIGLFILIS
jgi:hypothetical protein